MFLTLYFPANNFVLVDQVQFARDLQPVKYGKPSDNQYRWSDAFKELRKFTKLKVVLKHKGKTEGFDGKVYTIKRVVMDACHLNRDGANAKNTTFEWKNRVSGITKTISVYDYMRERYNQSLKFWQLPLVETVKGGFFPMELCQVVPKQRFPFKTDPNQVCCPPHIHPAHS